jgi:hypothetical protein
MPTNFVDELKVDIAAFAEAISGRARSRDSHVAVTASLDAAIDRGIRAVLRVNAIVENKFRDDRRRLRLGRAQAMWSVARGLR